MEYAARYATTAQEQFLYNIPPNQLSKSEERVIRGLDYLTINDALGTKPSSFSVAPKSTASKTFFGKFCVKLCTSLPVSWLTAEATS